MKVDAMAKEIEKTLQAYAKATFDDVKDAANVTGYRTQEKLHTAGDFKNISGDYRKGWTWKLEILPSKNIARAIVHNKTDYRLTHLLEFGHRIVKNGRTLGRTQAFEHIGPANEEAQQMFIDELTKRIEG